MMNDANAARRSFCRNALCAAFPLQIPRAWAARFPSKPVKIIVPFPAGGALDSMTRQVATKLTEALGQPFVIENKSGATGEIGAATVTRAPADGYTLLSTYDAALTIPNTSADTSRNPLRDVIPLAFISESTYVLIAGADFQPSSLKELLTFAGADPGRVKYGSPGMRSQHHLLMEQFAERAKVDMLHVPYTGGAPMMNALLGGQIDILLSGVAAPLPHLKTGKLKAIASAGHQRHPLLPAVPTFAEAGMSNFSARTMYGLFAPAGTPHDVVTLLTNAIVKVTSDQAFSENAISNGFEFSPSIAPQQIPEFLRAEREIWKEALEKIDARGPKR